MRWRAERSLSSQGKCSRALVFLALFAALPELSSRGEGWQNQKSFSRHGLMNTERRRWSLPVSYCPSCAFPEDGCKTHLLPIIKDIPISMIFQRQKTLSETQDAEKLVLGTCLAKICPTLLKLLQLQATLESCSCVLHPAHGCISPHPSLSHYLWYSVGSIQLSDSR